MGRGVGYGVDAERQNRVAPAGVAYRGGGADRQRVRLHADAVRVHVGRLNRVAELQRVRVRVRLQIRRLALGAPYLELQGGRAFHRYARPAEGYRYDRFFAAPVCVAGLRRPGERYARDIRVDALNAHPELGGGGVAVGEVEAARPARGNARAIFNRNRVFRKRRLRGRGAGYDAGRGV